MKKFLGIPIHIFDLSVDIKKRLFYILVITSVCANTIGFTANFLLYGFYIPTVVCGVFALLMVAISLIGHFSQRVIFAANTMLFLLNILEFPFLYYVYGNSTIPYMLLGCVGVVFYVEDYKRIPFFLIILLYDVAIIFFSKWNPSVFGVVSPEGEFGSTVCSFSIAMISIFSMTSLWISQIGVQRKEMERLNNELKMAANQDALTKAYNRRYLTEQLNELFAKNISFSAVLLDLDNFKGVNDEYGHIFGDEVLVNFCEIIRSNLSENDILARFGGEEFLIIFQTINQEEISRILCCIKEEFAAFSMRTKGIVLTFSGGGGIFERNDEITRLYRTIDQKLYKAKNKGKNQIIWEDLA